MPATEGDQFPKPIFLSVPQTTPASSLSDSGGRKLTVGCSLEPELGGRNGGKQNLNCGVMATKTTVHPLGILPLEWSFRVA